MKYLERFLGGDHISLLQRKHGRKHIYCGISSCGWEPSLQCGIFSMSTYWERERRKPITSVSYFKSVAFEPSCPELPLIPLSFQPQQMPKSRKVPPSSRIIVIRHNSVSFLDLPEKNIWKQTSTYPLSLQLLMLNLHTLHCLLCVVVANGLPEGYLENRLSWQIKEPSLNFLPACSRICNRRR